MSITAPVREIQHRYEPARRAQPAARLLEAVNAVAAALFLTSCAGVYIGALALVENQADELRMWTLGAITLALAALAGTLRRETQVWDRWALGLLASCVAAVALLALWPEYIYGHEINGIIHRSLVVSAVMLVVSLPSLSMSLYYLLGATPTASDTARYPLLLFPIMLVLCMYGAVLLRLAREGAPDLSWHLITTPYTSRLGDAGFVTQAGLRNYILGTLLLIGMTSGISLPIGVGTGVYLSEYEGWLSRAVEFSTLMLRAISVFILGVTAFTLAQYGRGYAAGDMRSDLLRGYYTDPEGGFRLAGHGSFLVAAIVLSFLVIPVIARATEEGLRSVPREIREGSLGLGATDGHGLLHILLPWCMPNIITGLLLGAAEASGSVAVLLFIAGSGQFGVGPLQESTSLAFLVYESQAGTNAFVEVMGPYRFAAAFLLIILTFGLSIAALLLKQRFAARYRAGGF